MQKYLEVWKGKYGEFTAPVPAKGLSSTDERRLVLNDLVNAILIEVPFVQGQGFAQAQAQHTANTQSILGHIQAAEAQNVDRRLKNSADWILNGGVTRIYAATPTGDSTRHGYQCRQSILSAWT
ncbi:hypothetical protein [Undibacterium danionis]|uniref:Uncharacterized protein n=1 Tax=Undibacterium danionis TaxID=1812100 RepID=A0ABV6IA10_9BURK